MQEIFLSNITEARICQTFYLSRPSTYFMFSSRPDYVDRWVKIPKTPKKSIFYKFFRLIIVN